MPRRAEPAALGLLSPLAAPLSARRVIRSGCNLTGRVALPELPTWRAPPCPTDTPPLAQLPATIYPCCCTVRGGRWPPCRPVLSPLLAAPALLLLRAAFDSATLLSPAPRSPVRCGIMHHVCLPASLPSNKCP